MSNDESRAPHRIDGYAPIRDYAAIGNRRTVALVARDGAVDWLCLPRLDSPSAFGALLDSRAGGRLELSPATPFASERRYLPETNVLETTFTTDSGRVRITDALTLREDGTLPWNELARRVEVDAGEVELRWRIAPRFAYGSATGEVVLRQGRAAILHGRDAILIDDFGLGEATLGDGEVGGTVTLREGDSAMLALSCFHDAPLLRSARDEIERRMRQTIDHWRRRCERITYDGPWREQVLRSFLALDLLVDASTGGIAAAATMALPERIGGPRNFDYRYAWLRDGNFTLDAMLRLGDREQVHISLAWMLRTIARTMPRLQPFYRLDGNPHVTSEALDLPGYRDSQPVTLGNPAISQLQLGNFGDLLDTVSNYVDDGNALDAASGRRIADVVSFIGHVWEHPDAGIWELGEHQRYTQSAIACWIALDRGCRLADAGEIPADDVERWRELRARVERFVETECWSERQGAYARYAGSDDELDAAVLLAVRAGYGDAAGPRMRGTVDALRERLGHGPLLYRYSNMEEAEGCFLACSFWVVEALARGGRTGEAGELMEQLLALGNDVGLYSEEMDPGSHEMLGNFPQALTHLALVNAASIYHEATAGG